MSRRTTYLLHFIDPATGQATRYRHAGHYIGDTEKGREGERLEEHRGGRGAVLTAAARRAGLDFVITRTWAGGASKARQLKTRSGALYCPDCSEHPVPGTRPRRLGAKYLTRRQREAAKRDREARQQDACGTPAPGAAKGPEPGFCWPGQPSTACPGCEHSGQAHNTECDERERAVARFLADVGVEPREETGMAEPQGPLTSPELDEEIGRLAELYPEPEYSAKEMADRAAEEEADYAYDELAEQLADAREAEEAAALDIPAGYRAAYGDYEPDWIPSPDGVSPDTWDRYVTSQPGSDTHRAAYIDMHREANGRGFPGADPYQSYLADHGYENDADRFRMPGDIDLDAMPEGDDGTEPDDAYRDGPGGRDVTDPAWYRQPEEQAERYYEEQAAGQHFREMRERAAAGDREAAEWLQAGGDPEAEVEGRPGAEPGPDAASWGPEMGAPDHLYRAPECAEADPETEHFGWSQPEPEDAGRFPLPRVLEDHEVSRALAPVAATLPDGTPRADPLQAARGWQAQSGLYVRGPQAQLEAG